MMLLVAGELLVKQIKTEKLDVYLNVSFQFELIFYCLSSTRLSIQVHCWRDGIKSVTTLQCMCVCMCGCVCE